MLVACSRLQGSRIHEIDKAHYLIASTFSPDHALIFSRAFNLCIIPAIQKPGKGYDVQDSIASCITTWLLSCQLTF